MVVYTVEYYDDSVYRTYSVLESMFSNFEKAKEYVENNVVFMDDFYEITKYVLANEEYQAVEITRYENKEWKETEPCHKAGE